MKNNIMLSEQGGFAVIVALLALLILMAVGVLVFTVTTQDIRVNTRVAGEKKAFSAAESGIHRLIICSNANSGNLTPCNSAGTVVDNTVDANSNFTITESSIVGLPAAIPMTGYEIGGKDSKMWGQTVTNKTVTGNNSRYNSSVTVDVGIGYGPVEISTSQPAAGG